MIPIRDENQTRTVPYVMYALVALNIILYLIDLLGTRTIGVYNGSTLVGTLQISGLWNYTMVPAQIIKGDPNLSAVIASNVPPMVHHSPSPTWLTILTSMFLHANIWHIGSNMLYLWIFGNNIEDALGHVKFLIFYLLGGVAAALAHIFSDPNSLIPTMGASGAIAAVLGAYLYLFPKNRVLCLVFFGFFVTTVAVPAVVVLGIWFLLQFVSLGATHPSTSGGVAYYAHIGGFIAGIIMIILFGGRRLIRGRYNTDTESWYDR